VIVFARHGQTAANREGRIQGRIDAPLTELGVEQARLVAEALASLEPALLVTSPLLRAAQTAEEIARRCGLDVKTDDRLLELDYGEWDGRRLADIDPHEWAAWRDDPTRTLPGGESVPAVRERIASFCREHLDGRTVVAVSHVTPIKAAVVWALGAGDGIGWRAHLDLASLTRIGGRPQDPVLRSFNETGHLRNL
jgi:broad specificity phosphatase PhoE